MDGAREPWPRGRDVGTGHTLSVHVTVGDASFAASGDADAVMQAFARFREWLPGSVLSSPNGAAGANDASRRNAAHAADASPPRTGPTNALGSAFDTPRSNPPL